MRLGWRIGLGVPLVALACKMDNPAYGLTVGGSDDGGSWVGGSSSAEAGSGDASSQGDGDATGDGDGASGDGDGDGSTGDGDGGSGDGDGSTGDGDGSTGDGDGGSGDGDGSSGDGTSGDGDGDGSTGDGDGDGTTGDGDGDGSTGDGDGDGTTGDGTSGDGSTGDGTTGDGDGTTGDGDGDGECQLDTDCTALYGGAPCGAWSCVVGTCDLVCGDCVDGDNDGYGTGMDCLGGDCDDSSPAITNSVSIACWTGDPGLRQGECRDGRQACLEGVWGNCVGEIGPSSETCNGLDDDCNGTPDDGLPTLTCGLGICSNSSPACVAGVPQTCMPSGAGLQDGPTCNGVDDDCDGVVDEDCITNCVWVDKTSGSDVVGDGTLLNAYATIAAGIGAADTTGGQRVCVAGGSTCQVMSNYPEDVVMVAGVDVFGSYETTTQTQCALPTTVIAPISPEGVVFGAGIMVHTTLDSFAINRAVSQTTRAVTVDGAQTAVLSRLVVGPVTNALITDAWGVNVINGGRAQIVDSTIDGGSGSNTSIAVRAVSGVVELSGNCSQFDGFGRCSGGWPPAGNRGIGVFTAGAAAESTGVYLESAAGSFVRTSNVFVAGAASATGIRIEGSSAMTEVSGNLIEAIGETNAAGVHSLACSGASPLIEGNSGITGGAASGGTTAEGVVAEGDCHPIIRNNVLIAGGLEGAGNTMVGVRCDSDGATASRCVIVDNPDIRGSSFGVPPVATGVVCSAGACALVRRNSIDAVAGVASTGLSIEGGSALIDSNTITGGCGAGETVAVAADDSGARFQNNVMRAGTCSAANGSGTFTGMLVTQGSAAREVDVHSNVLSGVGGPTSCTGSQGLRIEALNGTAGAIGRGAYRNNVVQSGACATNYGVLEASNVADPVVFEHNDIDPAGPPAALYRDEASTNLGGIAAVNALTDMVSTQNIDDAPAFVGPTDYHLQAGSACIGAGTSLLRPLFDFEGDNRGDPPDIGVDEFVP